MRLNKVRTVVAAALVGVMLSSRAAGGLIAGDIVILGVNSDNPDEFAWSPLVDLLPGTELFFSDAGWINNGFSGLSGASQDGGIRLIVPITGLKAGTISIVGPSLPSGYSPVLDSRLGPGLDLRPTGDQLVVFSESVANPNFLFAVNTAASQWGTTGGSNSNNIRSDLYPGLTNGLNAIALGTGPRPGDEFDNVRYEGITRGPKSMLLGSIAGSANWAGANLPGSSDRFADLANGAAGLSVQAAAVPEPASISMMALGAAALAGFGKRRSSKKRRRLNPRVTNRGPTVARAR